MIRAVSLCGIALLLAVPDGRARDAAPGMSAPEFRIEEVRLRTARDTATGAARTEGARSLAALYARQRLHVETLAALDPADSAAAAILLRAGALFGLGRDEDLLRLVESSEAKTAPKPALRAFAAMAHARRGADARAAEAFAEAGPAPFGDASPWLTQAFHLLAAESLRVLGKTDAARDALRAAGAFPGDAETQRLAEFLSAAIAGFHVSRDSLRRLAAGEDESAARSRIALIRSDLDAGRIEIEEARSAVRAELLSWRGGRAEREALHLLGVTSGDEEDAFYAFRDLAERHVDADLSADARARLGVLTANLAREREGLSAAAQARLFYDMVAFAPPGAEGDALIRRVAGRLRDLDLLAEAAALLEHQTFSRLRGAERAETAAELAAIYLDDQRPEDAVRVIASTRIAGLPPELDARRLLLETRALAAAGETEAALARLDGATGADGARLRGDIAWSQKDFPRAAGAYAEAFSAAPRPVSAADADLALRAAAAFILAGDRAGYAGMRDTLAASGAPQRAIELAAALGDGARAGEALALYGSYFGARGAGGR